MTYLADSKILEEMAKGNIVIEPFFPECLGGNSYDVHLGRWIAIYTPGETLDAKKENPVHYFEIGDEGFLLEKGRFYLGVTFEYTETRNFVPEIEGKSGTGRLSISSHKGAGAGDAGFGGYWTLHLAADQSIKIYHKMPIAQLRYKPVLGEILNPYNQKSTAKYNDPRERNEESEYGRGDMGRPIPSMMWKNFGKDPLWR